MKISIILMCFIIIGTLKAQTVYDVTPGTKGNTIILALENISDLTDAEDINIKADNSNPNFVFEQQEISIEKINTKSEKDVEFKFDIKRDIHVNQKDTLTFNIMSSNGLLNKKQLIVNVTPPKEFRMEQNFPNPFNPSTRIQYQLPYASKVSLKIYNVLGEEVATLINQVQDAGYKEVNFNASHYASGMYIYRIIAQNNGNTYTSVKKMMLLK